MQNFFRQFWCVLSLTMFAGGAALNAFAADVGIAISSQDTYVGMPVILQIQVGKASQIDPPDIPDVAGLEIKSRGTPARSTQIVTINGTTTTTTSQTYVYEVIPQHAGNFHIPPITVWADGSRQQTRAIDFVASKSETDDLMFVEVGGKENQIYVGQALDLTLKIWLRPFRDNQRNITLSAADMWQLISERSTWGVFADQIKQLTDSGQCPSAREVLRKDRAGVEHSYYLYETNATIYPKRPGKIDANDVHVIANYPIALGTSRSPFSGVFDDMRLPGGFTDLFGDDNFPSPFGPRLTVRSVRPIVAVASVDPIDVLSIPTVDRPADYRGAVGHYQIVTEAEPTTVKAGDPINLLMGIAGTGPMELVQAPPLAELSELTSDFKVPNEPLAGFVQDDRKIFSTTIRPRNEGITQIPSIPFTFFDPHQNKFIRVGSKPISIHVDPADNLALDAIVSNHTNADNGRSRENKNGAVLSFENYGGDDLLMDESPLIWDTKWMAWSLMLPPLVVLAIFVMRNRRWLSQFAGRYGSGIRRAQVQIDNAKSAAEVCRTLQRHLQREFALSADSTDTHAVIGALRTSGLRNLAVRCERVLSLNHESDASGIAGRPALAEVKRETLELLEDLQTEGRRRHAKPTLSIRKPSRIAHTATRIGRKASEITIAAIFGASVFLVGGSAFAAEPSSQPSLSISQHTPMGGRILGTQSEAGATGVKLTMDQAASILAEANDSYNHALHATGNDSATAKQAFAEAAEKYQLLVDSGVANSRLYFNLANAYLQSGQKGKATANYWKALRLDPTNRNARRNLAFAAQAANLQSASPEASHVGGDFSDYASAANHWLSHYIGPRAMLSTAIVAWFALWLAIGLQLVGIRFPWKSLVATAIVIGFIAAGSYATSNIELRNNAAVVSTPSVTLREGDGQNFPEVSGAQLHEGQTVELLKRRGNWIEVRSSSGQTGWLLAPSVEIVGSV